MQSQPLEPIKDRFEQFDFKLLADYDTNHTTHVVSRKRNTAKGLQALLCGSYIVSELFLDAIVDAAVPPDGVDSHSPSPLEDDFRRNWPDALAYLPAPGGEPVQHDDSIYKPDLSRAGIFEGYTFIFYDRTQFSNLLAPITQGGGKALMEPVKSGETAVDDFIRYVKSIAGEKGLGEFEDGSEGKGVVLVRYVPSKGEEIQWYLDFFTRVSLQLDHRPIEQNEFLEAILIKDASILRRPLEREATQVQTGSFSSERSSQPPQPQLPEPPTPAPKRAERRPLKRRFAGFAPESDDEPSLMDIPPARAHQDAPALAPEPSMFVDSQPSQVQDTNPLPSQPGPDLLEGMAEGAASYKRQKISHRRSSPVPVKEEPAQTPPKPAATKKKAPRKTADTMELVAQKRQEEEDRRRAEEEDMANLPDDIDLAEIRRLNIVEEMPLREPPKQTSRDEDIANGRWKPEWNGMPNFKKFKKRGDVRGRERQRIIVGLTHVKTKDFGIGDEYWLEDESAAQESNSHNISTMNLAPGATSLSASPSKLSQRPRGGVESEAEEEEEEEEGSDAELPDVADSSAWSSRQKSHSLPKSNRAGGSGSASTRESHRKRPAAAPPESGSRSFKRQRSGVVDVGDSDEDEEDGDSEDELKFRFRRRR